MSSIGLGKGLTEIAKKKDKEEEERVDQLYKEADSGKEKFTDDEIFGSKIIGKILSGKPLAYYNSFMETESRLPLNCLLFSQVLVNVCPDCSCNFEPSLIKPYLENGVVLPILNNDLAAFTPRFIDLIVQYPYIGTQAFGFLIDGNPASAPVMCEHCYEKEWRKIFAKIARKGLPQKEKEYTEELLQVIAKSYMEYPSERETLVLRQMIKAADQGDLRSLSSLARQGILISALKFPCIFDAIPQVEQIDLNNINEISKELGFPSEQAINEIQEEELTVKALNLEYNPKMPIGEYLDIILPRRRKINALVRELIEQGSENREISRINDELWQINKDIVSSKSLESLSFLTRLVTDNLNIVASLLAGALIGYSSAELFGCGIGSAAGVASSAIGIMRKRFSQQSGARIPSVPRKTVEWMRTQLESPQEKILSLLLSKDIKAIQVWQLRRRLRKM
jgi:hypothetical protein